ncbi:MAG: tetratricopeptide repeat protein, partial [Gammaproteobacteria bacterium]|nr:tetratricopeptide repeat protein [Gammaproteobacteria bacterium]
TAEQHFRAAMHLEPDYQKAHHNLALVLHLGGNEEDALEAVDAALRLDPGSRESLLLKGVILDGLGRSDEAAAISARAAALPANDWSERAGVR